MDSVVSVQPLNIANVNRSLLGVAHEWFQKLLFEPEGKAALQYLMGRGYSEQNIKNMQVGHFPGKEKLKTFLLNEGFSEEDIFGAFDWMAEDKSRAYYPVVIAHRDEVGNLLCLFCRNINDAEGFAKYLPLTKVGNSKAIPFGLHEALGSNLKEIILVEGEFDALSAHSHGFTNVVSMFGNKVTAKQVETLKQHGVAKIVIVPDGDDSGLTGAKRSFRMLSDAGFSVALATLPNGVKDADELLRLSNGADNFRQIIDRAETPQADLGRQKDETEPSNKAENGQLPSAYRGDPLLLTNLGQGFSNGVIEPNPEYVGEPPSADNLDEELLIKPYTTQCLITDLKKTPTGISTGFPSLDKYLLLQPGTLTVVGGRTSHGKTAMQFSILVNLLRNCPHKSFLYFSFEDNQRKLATRLIQNIAAVEGYGSFDQHTVMKMFLGRKDLRDLNDAPQRYDDWVTNGRLLLDARSHKLEAMVSLIRRYHSQNDIGAVFIDYIQKIHPEKRIAIRQQELQYTSEILRELAVSLSIPIVMGCQFGRSKEKSERGAVRSDNIRECGDIEQDANAILGLYNTSLDPSQAGINSAKCDLEVTILKNRDGESNRQIILDFDQKARTVLEKSSDSSSLNQANLKRLISGS